MRCSYCSSRFGNGQTCVNCGAPPPSDDQLRATLEVLKRHTARIVRQMEWPDYACPRVGCGYRAMGPADLYRHTGSHQRA